MPVIAVNLSQKTYTDIMTLVAQGGYSGPEQFLEIAAFNQLALERGLTPEELLKGIHQPAASSAREKMSFPPPPKGNKGVNKGSGAKPEVTRRSSARERVIAADVSDAEVQAALSRFAVGACAALRLDPGVEDASLAAERIWGQVNRLFPVKVACRWIATAAAAAGAWPGLHFILDKIATDAGTLGTALEKADGVHTRRREELLATGLPRKGSLQSSDRFVSQFIARVNRANRVYPGAVAQYGLACFSSDSVRLTRAGVEFARLRNPVLDDDFGVTGKSLSEDEKGFLVRQVWEHVPAEKQDFSKVLKAIASGSTKPDSLMAAIRSDFPDSWTDVAFRTHIYGVMGRLAELGVLTKRWEGRTVEYSVAETALGLLAA